LASVEEYGAKKMPVVSALLVTMFATRPLSLSSPNVLKVIFCRFPFTCTPHRAWFRLSVSRLNACSWLLSYQISAKTSRKLMAVEYAPSSVYNNFYVLVL